MFKAYTETYIAGYLVTCTLPTSLCTVDVVIRVILGYLMSIKNRKNWRAAKIFLNLASGVENNELTIIVKRFLKFENPSAKITKLQTNN